MKRGKIMAAFLSAAMLVSSVPTVYTDASEPAIIDVDKVITIKGWDGTTESGLDIADKQSGLATYNQDSTATGSGHDVNVGFISVTIPANTETKNLKLKLTSSKGQYSTATSAYAAVVDLNSTVATGQTAAKNIDGITWANRPSFEKTTKAVAYTTGGYGYVDDLDNDLVIPLVDGNGDAIIAEQNSDQTVVLAVYFNGKSVRETFSSAEITYETEKETEYLDLSDYYMMDYSGKTSQNPSYAYDKDENTAWSVNRNSGTYNVAYMVFYAGDGKVFDVSGIKSVSNGSVTYYGTNDSKIMFALSALIQPAKDISKGEFATEYNLTKLTVADTSELAEVSGKYRYLVAEPNNWPSTNVSEIYIKAQIEDEALPAAKNTDTLLSATDAYSLPSGMSSRTNTVTSNVAFAPFGLTASGDSSFTELSGITADKAVTYKINASEAKIYTLYGLGSSASGKTFAAAVNGAAKNEMTELGPVSENMSIYKAEISLNEGINTISITGKDGDAPALDAVYVSSTAAEITAEPQNSIKLYSIRGRVMARYSAYYNTGAVTVKLSDGANEQTAAVNGIGTIFIDKTAGSNRYTATLTGADNTVLATDTITASDAGFANLNSVRLTNDGSAATENALGDYALFDSANIGLNYVLSLDTDKLLYPAYAQAGLESECGASTSYGNWESIGIKGHTLGHYLSALSVFYAATENTAEKAECLSRIKKIVNALDYIQKNSKYMNPDDPDYNNGLDRGYIGGIDPVYFNKGFNGTVTTGFPGTYNDGWAPWYNVHKTYQGLIDVYNNTNGKDDIADTALDVCKKFSDWAVNGLNMMPDELVQEMLEGEFGGMGETMYELFDITGNYDYLRTADRFTHKSVIEPLAEETDKLSLPENSSYDEHANTQIPKINGVAGIYTSDPEKEDYKTASEYFWDRVTGYRSYVFGGNSIEEFFEPLGDETLGAHSAESCNTHNMLILTQRIFNWDHDSKYMDYYENALFNHIIGTQDPHTGGKSYFTSTLSGGHRTFSTTETSFWCCTGTGMENPGRYGEAIYYKDNKDLYVNLFVNSTLDWTENGMKISQTTKFPYENTTKIKIESGSGAANIKIRVPSWAKGMTVQLNNGEARAAVADSKGYYTISKSDWAANDEITVVMPMELSMYKSKADNTTVAFRYGPILLAAPLGAYDGCIQNDQQADASKKTVAAPKLTKGAASESVDTLLTSKNDGKLTFTLSGDYTSDGQPYDIIPFFDISTDSYNMYWLTDKGNTQYLTNEVGPFMADEVDLTNADNNIINVHFGVVRKTDDSAAAFGFKVNHSAYGKYVGGLDNGYVTKEVTIPRKGHYTAYVLCATNNTNNRSVVVSVDDTPSEAVTLKSDHLYAERDLKNQVAAYIVPVECGEIDAGEHTIKISSADGTYGANFAGFALLNTDEETTPTPPEPTEYGIKYNNGNAVVEVLEAGKYTVIFAAYSESGTLIAETIEDITFDEAGKKTVEAASFNTSGAKTVKVMLWESMSSMKPKCATDQVTLTTD